MNKIGGLYWLTIAVQCSIDITRAYHKPAAYYYKVFFLLTVLTGLYLPSVESEIYLA